MTKAPKIEIKCEQCGKQQPEDRNASNENWAVFDCHQKCECGGRFVMYIDGKKLG